MSNWIETEREQGKDVDRLIGQLADRQWVYKGTDFSAYVPDGEPDVNEFRLWMALVDRGLRLTTALGVFDHEDYLWRDAFDAGSSPRDAVSDFLEDSGIGAMLGVMVGGE